MLGISTASLGLDSQAVDRVWRGREGEGEYLISMLTTKHPKYQGIKARFLASWLHPGPQPTVMRIYEVRNPQQTVAMYSRYKDALVAQSPERGEQRRGGAREVINEQPKWHAAPLSCSFGIDINQRPCSDSNCAVCSICASSFELSQAGGGRQGAEAGGQEIHAQYGHGLYFTKVSSKANSYVHDRDSKAGVLGGGGGGGGGGGRPVRILNSRTEQNRGSHDNVPDRAAISLYC